ncbi:MAG: acetate kinase [Proteobacteria bacterium]|nr:MAG: acetate kinase [Pseudomonadota bacterium]
MSEAILIFNAGSSSIKFAFYGSENCDLLAQGSIGKIVTGAPEFRVGCDKENWLTGIGSVPKTGSHKELSAWLMDHLDAQKTLTLMAAGHRVVHGGTRFSEPTLVTPEVVQQLAEYTPLAPNHQPYSLAAIEAIHYKWPDIKQVVCFDTAFHRDQPAVSQHFAIPRKLTEEGVIRYGFHGLSYQYIANTLPEVAGSRADGRVIVAHLGNGASLCAMRERKSVASTMGFSALDGLMMGRRCGSIDAGVVFYLMRHYGKSLDEVEEILYRQSGLLGVSGISSDVRELQQSQAAEAYEALDLFTYRAACEVGTMAASLSGLDVLVFTAGIGEHSAMIRRKICERCAWLGIDIDPNANDSGQLKISSSGSEVDVYVLPTNEEVEIAAATLRRLSDDDDTDYPDLGRYSHQQPASSLQEAAIIN